MDSMVPGSPNGRLNGAVSKAANGNLAKDAPFNERNRNGAVSQKSLDTFSDFGLY